ncbi:2-keto-4-pentenoate hydratase [Pontibacillus yanchengensis]|uniref:2-keto-4-pentenoate hydratase n=2 Tax=Pontibacillus yanchengensis TaxID=462910 RepID=A0ACC7VFI9_9BACI|nr:2-keto-4-pentenoate hydratase [Pontibacillus yanchengensis]MYL32109.1 2-keto-4-pentenoate hydratase [Pontibacillus yanchengensis]MYL52689.1 2-keto-4-pentenoate hydratase [Pontibacillus yanchengensis]
MVKHIERPETTHQCVQPLTALKQDLTIDEAYQIQLRIIQHKVERGAHIVGRKIGLTSLAMQELLGVDEPDYGHLLDNMVVENGGQIPQGKVLQPKTEGEIAFVLKEDLRGPNVTVEDVLNATNYVVPAIEIVDSRIADWNITLQDTIADNASSGLYVLGHQKVAVEDVDLAEIQMELFKNGELMNTGKGSAALGNPAKCVAWLANKLFEYDSSLKSGEVILSGALSSAVNAIAGDEFTVRMDQLGDVSVTFTR